jgi:hypothetical protein
LGSELEVTLQVAKKPMMMTASLRGLGDEDFVIALALGGAVLVVSYDYRHLWLIELPSARRMMNGPSNVVAQLRAVCDIDGKWGDIVGSPTRCGQ